MDKKILKFIGKLSSRQKSLIVFSFDGIVAFCSFYIAIVLRFDGLPIIRGSYLTTLLSFVGIAFIQSVCFYLMGLYKGIWRFSSTTDLVKIIKGASIAVALSALILFFTIRLENIPRTAFIIDWLLLIVFLGGSRLAYRLYRDNTFAFNLQKSGDFDKAVIVGAGAGGEQLFREFRENPSLKIRIVAFVDDDSGKKGKSLHGINILGAVKDLDRVLAKTGAQKVFIAIPSATGSQIKKVVESCQRSDIEFKTLPSLKDLLHGRIEFSQLRNIEPEDLLGREPVNLDQKSLGAMLTGKVVLVTGAGGSIGSEICHQIAKFNPTLLVIFEQTEFFIYDLELNLREKYPHLVVEPYVGDVRRVKNVEEVFKRYRPDVVFHAAAYKHVPMMECNPYAAIDVNVKGTEIVSQAANKFGAERFVMISTDKAVNPTNIMGASKRVAEMVIQDIQAKSSGTKYMTVRFGNVLGSSGSVIPLFKNQIEKGGPVTVTHQDVKRYFMSIPEACRLVMQAGSIGSGGEIFVLEMGEPVRILDLAKQMITLSGLVPDEDIDIQIIGLRPGEKLFEELLLDDEHSLPTSHPLVRVAKAREVGEQFSDDLRKLVSLSEGDSLVTFQTFLQSLVVEYKPAENPKVNASSDMENRNSLH
ncbi:MAG: polysaccharide biosynthesis protein [Bacteriovoracaceae bacterium]|jgi:FlaA1/EpsC-like NDP-sugar epimerase|nr:polysaccharide biosynthesis protein [Bacteriovoracaceae bacterium]